jgi:hypothetical protein
MSINRKEQLLNSANGLAANLFDRLDKLRKQSNETSASSASTISFHKNSTSTSTTINNNNLLVIEDDDNNIDDSNFDIDKLNRPSSLTKSRSMPMKKQDSLLLPDNDQQQQQQQPQVLLSQSPTASHSSKMTSSSSLFKISFLDDMLNKTNSVVDEYEETLRRKFTSLNNNKKKSIDITPTDQSQPSTPILKQQQQQEPPPPPPIFEKEEEEKATTTPTVINNNNLSLKYALLFPIICSILICLLINLITISQNSFISIILFYLFGFISGSLIVCGTIIYLLVKYDLLKTKTTTPITTTTTEMNSLLVTTTTNKNKVFDGVYKGWMNELRNETYDPSTYLLSKTRSVYLNLDGSILRLQSSTTHKISKRAVYGEKLLNNSQIQFNEQRIYDLTDCQVNILPNELVRKRYWSKKYPICLKNIKLQSKNNIKSSSSSSYQLDLNDILLDNNTTTTTTNENNTLILFARTDREKEEWFKLFKKSSAKSLLDSLTYLNNQISKSESSLLLNDNNNNSNEIEDNNTDDNNNNTISTQTDQTLIYDTSLNFMNTFLIRIFSDFYTHQFWITKIRTKIQNKLNTIKMPYFMEELKIIDLDLGFMIPIIKQTSEPWYDEKGLWCNLDIDYSGGIQILISTKLNLMKLNKTNDDLTTSTSTNITATTTATTKTINNDKKVNLAIINSDEEDSAESSGDELILNNDETVIETPNKSNYNDSITKKYKIFLLFLKT